MASTAQRKLPFASSFAKNPSDCPAAVSVVVPKVWEPAKSPPTMTLPELSTAKEVPWNASVPVPACSTQSSWPAGEYFATKRSPLAPAVRFFAVPAGLKLTVPANSARHIGIAGGVRSNGETCTARAAFAPARSKPKASDGVSRLSRHSKSSRTRSRRRRFLWTECRADVIRCHHFFLVIAVPRLCALKVESCGLLLDCNRAGPFVQQIPAKKQRIPAAWADSPERVPDWTAGAHGRRHKDVSRMQIFRDVRFF